MVRLRKWREDSKMKIIKHWSKKLKMTQKSGKISCVHVLEESLLLKCPYHPKWFTGSVQSLSKYQWHSLQLGIILRFIWNPPLNLWITKAILRKKAKQEVLPDLKTYCKDKGFKAA
jgi:hypothetical protein